MQKRVKNIIVLSIGVVALSFVSIASGVFPISALTGEPSTTSNETGTSASQTDVMIDISDFFGQSDEEWTYHKGVVSIKKCRNDI